MDSSVIHANRAFYVYAGKIRDSSEIAILEVLNRKKYINKLLLMNNMKEKTSFALVFGESLKTKVIDFLIDNQEFDYSLTDIEKGAEVGWTTLLQFWPELVKLGIVKKTRKIGRAELYKLNLESPLVKKLIEIDMLVSKQLIQKELDTIVA